MVLAAWLAGLVLAAALAWSLTFPLRLGVLMNAANRSLEASGDPRRLSGPPGRPIRAAGFLGGWYSVSGSDSLFVVFAVMRDGVPVPHGAEVSPEGIVVDVVPLGIHARQVADGIPPGLLRVHVRRIEAAFSGTVAR